MITDIPYESKKGLRPADKYLLTVKEASEYFNIGVKKIRLIAENDDGKLCVRNGGKFLIRRTAFEQFLEKTTAI